MLCVSVGYHILQEFYTLFLTRFKTYKIARHAQTKPAAKSLYRSIFLNDNILLCLL
jgi:hypothetical protein